MTDVALGRLLIPADDLRQRFGEKKESSARMARFPCKDKDTKAIPDGGCGHYNLFEANPTEYDTAFYFCTG
jgi:hypothetical protein